MGLIITDNEERTIENAAKNIGFKDLELRRKMYYGFYAAKKAGLEQLAVKLMKTGEFLNLNKEVPTIMIGEKIYGYDKTSGLTEKTAANGKGKNAHYYTSDHDNYFGESLHAQLKQYFKENEITRVVRGVHWSIRLKKEEQVKELIGTHLLHNPHSMKIVAL